MTARNFKDLTGQRFGKLTVISRCENDKYGRAQWLCKCTCGKTRKVMSHCLIRNQITCCEFCKKPITNYDRIRKMTVDEMVEHYLNIRNTCISCVAYLETCNGESENDCIDNIKQWLLQEVEE